MIVYFSSSRTSSAVNSAPTYITIAIARTIPPTMTLPPSYGITGLLPVFFLSRPVLELRR